MSQDTRKDPRAKVLTMTVRYKSATLDEFIEHHSYDVSRGGMFIKTPSPFPPGTLLKFEVKIAADQKVIQGVGRVVWKREHETTGDTRPAGMGVKFIKIDDASRKVIDTLVESRGDANSAYEAGGGDTGQVPAPIAASASAKPAATAAEGPKAASPRKATMIGLGAMNPSNRPAVVSSPQKPAPSTFFPDTNSDADMPAPEDRTVMKQAAELLQDALREAGGSMAEVGSTSKYADPPAKAAPSKVAELAPTPSAPSTQRSEPPSSVAPASAAKAASVRAASAAKPATATTKSTIPASARKIPATAASNRRVSVPAAVVPAASRSGGGGSRVVVIALVIAATGGLVYAFSSAKAPEPKPVVSAEPAPSAAPVDTASAAPSAATAESAVPAASASAAPAESAAPAASASAAPLVTAPPIARPAPVAVPKPVLQARPVPKPKPVAAPTEPSEPSAPTEPTAEKPSAPTPPAPAPTPEAPAPKPKPAEPAGDNPY